MKRISLLFILVVILLSLSACKSDVETRGVVEKDYLYNYVGKKSIEVNGDLFTTFCKQSQDDESGLWNTFTLARNFKNYDGKEYTSYALGGCEIFYKNTMYHGFDLLESKLLTTEELDLLEFPFWEVVD